MEDFFKFIAEHYPGLFALIEASIALVTAFFVVLIKIRQRGGKDIDGDGKPDVSPEFDSWYIVHNGERIYFRDMVFKEDRNEPKNGQKEIRKNHKNH